MRLTWAISDVVLYSVPSDVFELSKKEQQEDCQLRRLSEEDIAREEWIKWWPEDNIPANWPRLKNTRSGPKSVWPLFLEGSTIGILEGVVDIAVNSTAGELCIWAFAIDGRAVAWRVGRHNLVERRVAQDGRVSRMHELDVDGDVIMVDADDEDRFVHRTLRFRRALETFQLTSFQRLRSR